MRARAVTISAGALAAPAALGRTFGVRMRTPVVVDGAKRAGQGSAEIVHDGHTHRAERLEVVDTSADAEHFPPGDRHAQRCSGVDQGLRLRRAAPPSRPTGLMGWRRAGEATRSRRLAGAIMRAVVADGYGGPEAQCCGH